MRNFSSKFPAAAPCLVRIRTSISSKNTTVSSSSNKDSNISIVTIGIRGNPFLAKSLGSKTTRGQPKYLAIAFTYDVFPVPGGPKNIPERTRLCRAGCRTSEYVASRADLKGSNMRSFNATSSLMTLSSLGKRISGWYKLLKAFGLGCSIVIELRSLSKADRCNRWDKYRRYNSRKW